MPYINWTLGRSWSIGPLAGPVQIQTHPRGPKIRTLQAVFLAAAVTLTSSIAAMAADHQVMMLNKGTDGTAMVFEPAFLSIEVGDTVTFVPTDKSHNAETIKGMTPSEDATFKGKINEEFTYTFDVAGVYGYKCMPHLPMGMVGLIQVGGDSSNLEALKAVKVPPKAAARFEELYSQLQ